MEQIKPIKITDLDECLFVIRTSFKTIADEFNLTKENCPKNPSFMDIEILQSRFDNGYLMFGLYNDKQIVGFVSMSQEEDGAVFIHNLAVLPEYRHKGYGKGLLDYCEVQAKKLNGKKMKIDIIEENTILKDWYLKNSFIHLYTKKFEHLPFTVGFMEKII